MGVSLARKIAAFSKSPEAAEFEKQFYKECRIRRVENKAFENQGKKPLKSPDVLNADDFVFAPFVQERREGDSGSLYTATSKSDLSRKYIIKHALCHCAANEYVYSKLLKAMGLKTPEVKLFRLANPAEDKPFQTEYVAGIEYLNVVNNRPNMEAILAAKNADDYYAFLTLEHMLQDADSYEFVIADNGYLYRIDMADSFLVSEFMLMECRDKPFKHGFNAHVLSKLRRWIQIDEYMKRLIKNHGADNAGALIEPLFAVQKIHKPYINKFLETLRYFYPDFLCDYYGSYIAELKSSAKKFTDIISKVQAAPYFSEQKTG